MDIYARHLLKLSLQLRRKIQKTKYRYYQAMSLINEDCLDDWPVPELQEAAAMLVVCRCKNRLKKLREKFYACNALLAMAVKPDGTTKNLVKDYENQRAPRVYCNDGFSLSIQNRKFTSNVDDDQYVEVGFPSAVEPALLPYCEAEMVDPKKCVYLVPIGIVDHVIRKHGGVSTETQESLEKRKTKVMEKARFLKKLYDAIGKEGIYKSNKHYIASFKTLRKDDPDLANELAKRYGKLEDHYIIMRYPDDADLIAKSPEELDCTIEIPLYFVLKILYE